MSINIYTIKVGRYAEKHFIKDFSKNYRLARDKTFEYIKNDFLSRIDKTIEFSTLAEIITKNGEGHIIKCDFSILGLRQSAKDSGNRLIIYKDNQSKIIEILLVYSKTDIKGNNETVWRKQQIKNNYDFIKKLFPNL